MVTIGSLWLPILLTAVGIWIVSALIWMVMPHHKKDYQQTIDENEVRKALKDHAPGQYSVPYATSPDDLKDPETRERFEKGPIAFITVLPNGIPNMGKNVALSFVYYLVIGVLVAYLTSRTLLPGTDYLAVFRVAGTTSFIACGMGLIPDAIWFGRPWSAIGKHLFDALLYGLITGGIFGWLWP